ncbi:MAG: MFS transporter [Oscillospiraceae bacterium]|nr:MFS transporter [Oscillospiraceae bacterium]
MTTQLKKPKSYNHTTILACVLLSAASVGLLSYFNALFIVPVTHSLEISRVRFMMNGTIGTIASMIFLPLAGMIYQKLPMRPLLLVGASMGAAAQILFSLSNNVYGFYVGALAAGIGSCLFGSIPIALILAGQKSKNQGLMTGLAFTGSGIVAFLFSPVVSWMIEEFGWRIGYRVLATALMAIMIPTALFLVPKNTRKEKGEAAQNASKAVSAYMNDGFTRKQALSSPVFWIFLSAVFMIGMITLSTQQQLVAYWVGVGNSNTFAAAMFSVVMFSGMAAKILVGSVFDKAGIRKATIVCCALSTMAYLSLVFLTDRLSLLVPAILFGVVVSVQVIVPTYLTNKFFGNKEYGSILGIVNTVLFLGVSVGIPLSAYLYQSTGTYKTPWVIFAVIMALVLILLLLTDHLTGSHLNTEKQTKNL